mmetsp:Transcript_64933/g.132065  ORF Transcript_64933/g.132065 Transcript_64933/m.132065 type:complete len:227 (-) Transcript_64933:16-696(-)
MATTGGHARPGYRAAPGRLAQLPPGDSRDGGRVPGLQTVYQGGLRGPTLCGVGGPGPRGLGGRPEVFGAVHRRRAEPRRRRGLCLFPAVALRQEHSENRVDLCQPARQDLYACLRRHCQGLGLCEALGVGRLGRDGNRSRTACRHLQHLVGYPFRLACLPRASSLHCGIPFRQQARPSQPGHWSGRAAQRAWRGLPVRAKAGQAERGAPGMRREKRRRHRDAWFLS